MCSNWFQVNAHKAEVMWAVLARRQSQFSRCTISIAGASIEPVIAVRDLGVFIDSDLGAATHVQRTVARCFVALPQLCHQCRHVIRDCFRFLVSSFVHSRLDCDNFILVGLPAIFNDASQLFLTLQLV